VTPKIFVLILTFVIAAAGLTVWAVSATVLPIEMSPEAWLILVPALLLAYVLWRLVYSRARGGAQNERD